jgi:hypothetical protein
MSREPEHPVVTYTLTFTIPKEHVHREADEHVEKAIERTVQKMVLRLTDSYAYEYEFDPQDPLTVSVKVDKVDDPDGKSPGEQLNDALRVIQRMLGQRCSNPAEGERDTLVIDLHSDLAALELLEKHGWAEKWDADGKVTGYLH